VGIYFQTYGTKGFLDTRIVSGSYTAFQDDKTLGGRIIDVTNDDHERDPPNHCVKTIIRTAKENYSYSEWCDTEGINSNSREESRVVV
jgi:hypothetical protein